jgi:ANTAR domain
MARSSTGVPSPEPTVRIAAPAEQSAATASGHRTSVPDQLSGTAVPRLFSAPSPDDGHPVDPQLRRDDGTQLESLRQEIAGLKAALLSRATIDQARGILVARYQISPDAAFDLLVRWSQDRNIKLRAIAETLVAMAQHGLEGPGVDRSLGRWLARQLTEGGSDQ